MPRKVPLTPKQKRDKMIREYRKGLKSLDEDTKKTLQDIENNRFGKMILNDPVYEAAETYAAWKDEGII